jgi:hypothetical protein
MWPVLKKITTIMMIVKAMPQFGASILESSITLLGGIIYTLIGNTYDVYNTGVTYDLHFQL